ncbi:MAG TPA: sigma-70 family RNA polymerase sigma factor [Sandaracinaceae bacterium]
MDGGEWLKQRFWDERAHLHAVAYRMLGSASEADDAVQEAWMRLGRAEASGIENLRGWLTTVVARICLDMLRSRKARREDFAGVRPPEPAERAIDPETEMALADSVGLALLVVLDTLTPAERVAYVLHDIFDLPFEQIAPIVDRSVAATRQLASRARRRVRGAEAREVDLAAQREVVEAFLAAARNGDFDALLAVLDPDVVVRADAVASRADAPTVVRDAESLARAAIAGGARAARAALVNGSVGIVIAPRGKLFMVLAFEFGDGKIVAVDVIAEPERLAAIELGGLDA